MTLSCTTSSPSRRSLLLRSISWNLSRQPVRTTSLKHGGTPYRNGYLRYSTASCLSKISPCLKQGIIIPVYKRKDPLLVDSYRGITMHLPRVIKSPGKSSSWGSTYSLKTSTSLTAFKLHTERACPVPTQYSLPRRPANSHQRGSYLCLFDLNSIGLSTLLSRLTAIGINGKSVL